jgi:hypothetical protein
MVWAAISRYSILFIPLLPFIPNYCKGVRGLVGKPGASHEQEVTSEE